MTNITLHRIHVYLNSEEQWYDVMREANKWFGKNWRGQNHVRRKFRNRPGNALPIKVWFDVPDIKFDTWVNLKYPAKMIGNPIK